MAASALSGMSLALVVANATVRFQTEHMVTGLASNILALGLTSFLLRAAGTRSAIRVPLLQAWPIPVSSELPVIGSLPFNQPPLTYLVLLMIGPLMFFLYRTRAGLTLRAVGENPRAAFAAGANPTRIRLGAALLVLPFLGRGARVPAAIGQPFRQG